MSRGAVLSFEAPLRGELTGTPSRRAARPAE